MGYVCSVPWLDRVENNAESHLSSNLWLFCKNAKNDIKKPPNTFMPFLKGPSEFLQNGSKVVNAHLGKTVRVFLVSADHYSTMNAAIFSIRALISSCFIVWHWWSVNSTGGWICSPVLVCVHVCTLAPLWRLFCVHFGKKSRSNISVMLSNTEWDILSGAAEETMETMDVSRRLTGHHTAPV